MTAIEKWNRIVEIHDKHMGAKEQTVQGIWESIFAEILGYSRLDDEIERHRNIRIGSTERVITDIIIKNGETDLFVVELKQHNLPYSDEMELQLFSYLKQLRNDLGILICDKIYIYDYDYDKSDDEQEKVVIDFAANNRAGIKFVEFFSKDVFTKTTTKEFIRFAIDVETISNEVSKDLVFELLHKYFAVQYSSAAIEEALANLGIEVSGVALMDNNSRMTPISGDHDTGILSTASNTSNPSGVAEPSKVRDDNEQMEVIEEIAEKCVIIKVRQRTIDSYDCDLSDAIYKATRAAWKMRIERAEKADYVLSVTDGVVKAVFLVMQWRHNEDMQGRIEFEGKEASEEIKRKYIGKRIPQEYRRKGLASPCLYVNC